jgi:hypothetical protein
VRDGRVAVAEGIDGRVDVVHDGRWSFGDNICLFSFFPSVV